MARKALTFSILTFCACVLAPAFSYGEEKSGGSTGSQSGNSSDNQGSTAGNSSESSGNCPGRSECTCESVSEYQDNHCMDNTGMDIGR